MVHNPMIDPTKGEVNGACLAERRRNRTRFKVCSSRAALPPNPPFQGLLGPIEPNSGDMGYPLMLGLTELWIS